jgi:hypothetical protein
MRDNGMRFYQVFKFGGTIGVNSLSLSDLIFSNIIAFIVMLGLICVIAFVFPMIMLLVYAILLITNWESYQSGRIICNIFGIIGYIYFMFDYHFGFIGWQIFCSYFGIESVDKLCYINTGVFMLNILLIFFGNKIFEKRNSFLARLGTYCVILFLSYKVLMPIGKSLVSSMVTQHIPKRGELMTDMDTKLFGEPKDENLDTLKTIDEDFENDRNDYGYIESQLNNRLNDNYDAQSYVEPEVEPEVESYVEPELEPEAESELNYGY